MQIVLQFFILFFAMVPTYGICRSFSAKSRMHLPISSFTGALRRKDLATTTATSLHRLYSSSSVDKAASQFKLTSYNVLSSHLADSNYFTACNPEYLKANYRLPQLKKMLKEEMKAKSVICLQEISNTWAGALHSYFAANGYYLVTGMYGNKFNNYMGVGIAYPIDTFTLIDTDITRIADTKRMFWPPRGDKTKESFISGLKTKLEKTKKSLAQIWFDDRSRPPVQLWDNVSSR